MSVNECVCSCVSLTVFPCVFLCVSECMSLYVFYVCECFPVSV